MMFRLLLILVVFITSILIESVIIEYPLKKYIEERQRQDLNDIDPIFRYYILSREIQFNANEMKNDLPYFLRCKGSKASIEFTVPSSATDSLVFDRDDQTHTITIRLAKTRLTSDLVGRYTCSEKVNHKKLQETAVYVFIQNERSIFTKKIYSKVFKQTGIHFLNIPCQTTSWYPRISCPMTLNDKRGGDSCIPVYYQAEGLTTQKVFFDPQIGFALENPEISDRLSQFSCLTNATPSEESKIPYDKSQPGFVEIHQKGFTVMKDEIIQLSCEIRYERKVYSKEPRVYWFEDIHQLQLISNQTKPRVYNSDTKLYHQNSTLILQGLQPDKVYRFYCVRESDSRFYSRSVDITGVKAPSLNVEIDLSRTGTDDDEIPYGSDGVYDIRVLTVPRSEIQISILRNGLPLSDERFKISIVNNQEDRLWDYTLTIYNMTFEDEVDFNITVKASVLEKSVNIKPRITGPPVGELTFISEQIPRSIPWRNDNSKISSYGIYPQESYRIVCNVRHRSDQKRSLNIFIQYYSCSIDNCLSNLFDKTCQVESNRNSLTSTSHRTDKFQTQFVSIDSHRLDDPSSARQYLCCYEYNGFVSLAKAIAVLSHNRSMFTITKPEYGLITGDVLTYRCEGHQLIYDDLQMIYKDGLLTYERNRLDRAWHLQGSRQGQKIDIVWNVPISKNIRSMTIEVTTPRLTKSKNNAYFQCIGRSKRSDLIRNTAHTYFINVEDLVPMEFKKSLDKVSRMDRRAGDPVELDCTFNGRPKPRVLWLKGKSPINLSQSTFQFENNNGSLRTNRAQAIDTGYYTCVLDNGREQRLERSFQLRVEGNNPYSKFNRIISPIIIICSLLLLLMLIALIICGVKYCQMTRRVEGGVYHENKPIGEEDETRPALGQLASIPLPDNFASQHQIHAFLSYINGKSVPTVPEDFKELGRGQFGVVYQVRLPDVDLVAAKILPENIRHMKHQRDKRKKSGDIDENETMISKHEIQKKKAVEMLIDEMKVMHRAGKHVNIVALKRVAYPEARFKLLFTGGPIIEDESFYLMELCSNGSLQSMLKRFLQPSSGEKMSLYEILSKRTESEMTIDEAYEQCLLTDDDLKLIAYQVACGVDYLNRKQIAHCDIAARNVLVTSRFIMKICDFGLATWTTYKNYREQLAENESVQIEKKNNEIATHNLTPELARAFLRASNPDERLLLNKSSIKSDVWSFGIFLWTLFLKCRLRPFDKLLKEMDPSDDGESFFHRLARMISENHVLRYIDYQPEIPRNIYAIIRDCLVEENHRPEMTRIRAYLCHSNMLSKRAFQYYRSEYNRYQEENAVDGNVELLAEAQGVRDLPTFDSEKTTYVNPDVYQNVKFRPPINSELDDAEPEAPPTLPPRVPSLQAKKRAPIKPPRKGHNQDDSYL